MKLAHTQETSIKKCRGGRGTRQQAGAPRQSWDGLPARPQAVLWGINEARCVMN